MIKLSPREGRVLYYVSCGLSNRDIAYELGISIYTVKGHVSSLILGLGAANRVQLARWAHLHPKVFAGQAAEIAMHPPNCTCDHSLCVTMRKGVGVAMMA